MDREFVFSLLTVLLAGVTVLTSATLAPRPRAEPSVEARERRCWRALWRPLMPATLVVAGLCGWVAVEPDPMERMPRLLILAAVPFCAIWTRAVWRALAGLVSGPGTAAAVSLGFVRPGILVSPAFARAVDASALQAACVHEEAHARHHDPIRLWLARLATDLQWPLPAARRRFAQWRQALELARDQEARGHGADGADLAAAVLAAVRLEVVAAGPAASLHNVCEAEFLTERVARLLAPVDAEAGRRSETPATVTLPALTAIWTLAILIGATFGERAVRLLFRLG
ncbi:MAG: hypothetical protein KGN76_01805 [Acidobacteriota bacterium]|nr:hypothetical protein [Acidobacteriota bacterium]